MVVACKTVMSTSSPWEGIHFFICYSSEEKQHRLDEKTARNDVVCEQMVHNKVIPQIDPAALFQNIMNKYFHIFNLGV